MAKEKYYIQVPHGRHRELSDQPLVVLRADKSPLLEFNTLATKMVAEKWRVDLKDSSEIPVVLSFDPGLQTINVIRTRGHLEEVTGFYLSNMTIMSDRKDQFRINCADFLRIPQVKYAFKYLAVNGSDFGVITTLFSTSFAISLRPSDQLNKTLSFSRDIGRKA